MAGLETREGFDSSWSGRELLPRQEQALRILYRPIKRDVKVWRTAKGVSRSRKWAELISISTVLLSDCSLLPVKRSKCSAFFVRVSWCEQQLPKRDKFGRARVHESLNAHHFEELQQGYAKRREACMWLFISRCNITVSVSTQLSASCWPDKVDGDKQQLQTYVVTSSWKACALFSLRRPPFSKA